MLMLLNENIKSLRISTGLNQVEFAKKIGVSKQCVSNWENDNVLPSIEMLVKLSDFFNVSTDYLLGKQQLKTVNVEGLTDKEITHINFIIDDIKKNKNK